MNKNKLMVFLLSIAGVIGCTSDEKEISGNKQTYINLSPQILQETSRLSGNDFDPDDRVGVYVVPYEDDLNILPGDISQSTYAQNIEHIYNGVSWETATGNEIAWPLSRRHVDIYSYYPYRDDFTTDDPVSALFTVRPDQQNRENYYQSDFLWTKVTSVAPTTEPVPLTFTHRLSKVRINVKSEIPITNDAFRSSIISLLNTRIATLVNLSDGSVSQTSSPLESEIISFHHTTPVTGFNRSAEAIIVPQTISTGTPFIRIEFPSTGIRYQYTPTDALIFEQGKERTFTITITRSGISVTVGEIIDWEPSDVIEGEIGKPIPKVLDLRSIDWMESHIYSIYDNGIIVGEIAKEYLFRTGVDFPALVVYKMGSDGEIDRTSGFVVNVLNRDRNSVTNEYEVNTANVHGGTALWGTSNNLSSYTAGNLPVINKIELSGSTFTAAQDNAIPTISASPYRITDIDGNNYSIVKISNQYWMSENLKTEHYRDNSELTFYYYNDDESNKNLYGGLYTWNTATDPRGICPENWHIPTRAEFTTLYQYLTPNAGRKMKANILWSNLNYNDNVSGYSGIPAGRRSSNNVYEQLFQYGQWWDNTETNTTTAYQLYLIATDNAMHDVTFNKAYALSVRCIRD